MSALAPGECIPDTVLSARGLGDEPIIPGLHDYVSHSCDQQQLSIISVHLGLKMQSQKTNTIYTLLHVYPPPPCI